MSADNEANLEAAIDAQLDEYQRQQRPWLKDLLQAQHVIDEMNRAVLEMAAWRIEQLLKHTGADLHLQQLEDAGCDRSHLVRLLYMIDKNEMPQRWLGLKNRNELKKALRKLTDAEYVALTIQPGIQFFDKLSQASGWFAMFPMLPALLQTTGRFLQCLLTPTIRNQI